MIYDEDKSFESEGKHIDLYWDCIFLDPISKDEGLPQVKDRECKQELEELQGNEGQQGLLHEIVRGVQPLR